MAYSITPEQRIQLMKFFNIENLSSESLRAKLLDLQEQRREKHKEKKAKTISTKKKKNADDFFTSEMERISSLPKKEQKAAIAKLMKELS